MNMDSGKSRSDLRLGNMVATGMAIGAGFGVALGLVLDNLALGIAIGVGMGMAVGAALGGRGMVSADGEGAPSRVWLAALVGIGLLILLITTGAALFTLLATR